MGILEAIGTVTIATHNYSVDWGDYRKNNGDKIGEYWSENYLELALPLVPKVELDWRTHVC